MTPAELRDRFNREPFHPMRVHLDTGRVIELTVPRQTSVSDDIVLLGFNPDEKGLTKDCIFVDPSQIVKIEDLEKAAAA